MKRNFLYICLASIVFFGCTKNFDEINIDPTQASAGQFNPNLLLPTAQVAYVGSMSGYSGAILYQSMWSQTFASALFPSSYSNGEKYVYGGSFNSYISGIWDNAYGSAGKAYEIQNLTKEKPELSNLSGIALIVEIMNIQLITDVYGDCPFSQGLRAKSGITHPVYDKQQDIYNAMLYKLDSVIMKLDASKAKPTNDALPYAGDIAKWKKFGNSLMLRIAMRLTKVDPTTAKKYAEKAYQGGTFLGNEDNAYLKMDDAHGYTNGNAAALSVGQDYSEVRFGKQLIDALKAAKDPRLGVIAEVPMDGKANAANTTLAGNSNPDAQQGMPSGYDQNGASTDISKTTGYPGGTGIGSDFNPIGKYSRPRTAFYLNRNSPVFILTYAETELLLAEAAARGWNVGASAAEHYRKGLSAALQTYGTLNSVGVITSGTADAYAAANPLDVSSVTNSLKQINEQIWITTGTLFNWIEAWSNWRRSGYPELTPVNYTGNFTNGTIPRRQVYPLTESVTNGGNYKAAVGLLNGGDAWTSRVWWDK